MGNIGSYGTTIPVHIGSESIGSVVDITYAYHATRSYDSLTDSTFKELPSSILTPAERDASSSSADNVVEGMYNLQLPLSEFSRKGFYTVYIKPKEIPARISDVGTLTAYPNVRGIIIDPNTITDKTVRTKAKSANGLVGYRVVYLNDNRNRQDYYRIITSNNRCEPVVSVPNSSSDKSYTYRYDESSNLIFITLSPSSAPSFKSNALPYIGKPTQEILLINTLFEPIQMDIEMCENNDDTIAMMLKNDQLRDLDNGLITTFDENGAIYHQSEHFTLKNTMNGNPVYEVRHNRKSNMDFSQTISDKLT